MPSIGLVRRVEGDAVLTLFVIAARLALPERAAAIGLRSHMLATWPHAPDCDVDPMAEVAAAEAPARMIDGWREVRWHGSRASVLRGEIKQHRAIFRRRRTDRQHDRLCVPDFADTRADPRA